MRLLVRVFEELTLSPPEVSVFTLKCMVCYERFLRIETWILECSHVYCRKCVFVTTRCSRLVTAAEKSSSPNWMGGFPFHSSLSSRRKPWKFRLRIGPTATDRSVLNSSPRAGSGATTWHPTHGVRVGPACAARERRTQMGAQATYRPGSLSSWRRTMDSRGATLADVWSGSLRHVIIYVRLPRPDFPDSVVNSY